MYIGRFVILGKTAGGDWYLGYRVSSRSFPNRKIVTREDRALVVPTADAQQSDNPYISYNCLRINGHGVIVANGTQVDPMIDKMALGYPLRDAMATALLTLDYERDDYATPRIAAGVERATGHGYLGIVTRDKLDVRRLEVTPGSAYVIATYEITDARALDLEGDSAPALCNAVYEAEFEHPVAALAALLTDGQVRIAARSSRE